jgi:F420-dependent methylenetetrahydromethanopterin dehydrogenase
MTAYETAAPGPERNLILILARHSGLPAPIVGAEGPQRIPLDISWPGLRIAVASSDDMLDEDRDDLKDAGWSIFGADPESIIAAVAAAAPGPRSDRHGEF